MFYILTNFSSEILSHFTLDIFDNFLEMYYPITFRKPDQDVHNIISTDLEARLNKCVIQPSLLRKTYDMVFDKIGSNLVDTKICCLDTFIEIFVKYGNYKNILEILSYKLIDDITLRF